MRKALALAVNKKEIVEGVTRGGEIPALSMVPSGLPGYEPAQGEPYNPELARKLLAEAGYPGGQGLPKIEILYNTEEAHQSIAELIQAQWKENLGIDVGLQNMEWNAYLAAQTEVAIPGFVALAGLAIISTPTRFSICGRPTTPTIKPAGRTKSTTN